METAVQQASPDLASPATANPSPVQAQVAAILARGQSITDAARQAGIHQSTIHHRLQHSPDFKAAVEDVQRFALSAAFSTILEGDS